MPATTKSHLIHANRLRQIAFLIFLVLIGGVLAKELVSFIPALLGAITFYVVMRNWMLKLTEEKNWKKAAAASLLMGISLIVILAPIYLVIQMMASKVGFAVDHANEAVESLKTVVANLENRIGIKILSPENINNLTGKMANMVPNILGATVGTLVTIFFMYFILFFMLTGIRELEEWMFDYLPLKDNNVDRIGKEMKNIVFSNAVGIPVIALMQGIVALIGYFILGVKEPIFWFVIASFTAMLPMIGAAFSFVPVAIIFFANDDIARGLITLIYGFGVIGTVDNIFRFMLAKKIGNIHPLITVFGVIIGIQMFGFIGLIFGPVLISFFILMVKIYNNEFSTGDDKMAEKASDAEKS